MCSSVTENETTEIIQVVNPVDNFAKLGARAGLSFAFAFLKKTWRCGMLLNFIRDMKIIWLLH